MAISKARLEYLAQIEDIFSRGEPPLQVKGKVNPDWIIWYRALQRVSSNVAMGVAKRKIRESREPKTEQPPVVHKAPPNPYGKRIFHVQRG